jgi:hypothetical protein
VCLRRLVLVLAEGISDQPRLGIEHVFSVIQLELSILIVNLLSRDCSKIAVLGRAVNYLW